MEATYLCELLIGDRPVFAPSLHIEDPSAVLERREPAADRHDCCSMLFVLLAPSRFALLLF